MNEQEVKGPEDFDNDPMVPGDLLELHVALEEGDTSPEEFKKVYGK